MWKYKNNQKLKTPEKMSQICKPVRRAMLHFCIIIVEAWEWHLGCVSIPRHNHPSHAALFCGGGEHKKECLGHERTQTDKGLHKELPRKNNFVSPNIVKERGEKKRSIIFPALRLQSIYPQK